MYIIFLNQRLCTYTYMYIIFLNQRLCTYTIIKDYVIKDYVHIPLTEIPLTGEIRLKIFGSPGLSVFLMDLLSDGDSMYSRENSFEILRTPVKTCLICTGTLVKTGGQVWQQ